MFTHLFSLSKKNKTTLRMLTMKVWQVFTILVFLTSLIGMNATPVKADAQAGKYDWTLINVFADNYFSATFLPVNTIDENPDNMWFNAIDDTLPTSIWYEFPAEETISKVGLWQTSYAEPWSYRIKDYEIFVSTDGTTWTSVATNTGVDVPHAYQETSFTPVAARFVKITANYPSWEDETYLSYDTANWVGLDGFQAYDQNGDPLIDSAPLLLTYHTLTVNVTGNGNVTLDSPGGTYYEGQVVQLTANPDSGWSFSGWSGALSSSTNPISINMDADKTITATFIDTPPGKYDWTLINVFADNYFSADFLPVNTIDDNPDNMWFNAIDDALPTSIWYEFPAAETISMVGLWQTSYDAGGGKWSYRIKDYEIFVSTDGTTWTSVATNAGTDIPHAYQETYFTPVAAKFVKITAKYPSWEDEIYQSYDTKNWIGLDGFQAYDQNGNPLIDSAPLVLPRHTLTVGTSGNGNVSLDPPSANYYEGQVVQLTANPDTGWGFSSWSSALSGSSNLASITMDADKTVTANFTEIVSDCYTLTINHSGQGTDPVASPVKSAACSTNGQYIAGESVSLSDAIPDNGWQISNWTGTNNNGSTAGSNTVTMPASAHTASVNYTEIPVACYALTMSHTGQGSNPVASPVKSAACASNGQYVAGASISLSDAVPDTDWQIAGWTGTNNNASTAGTNTVTMPASAHSANVIYESTTPPVSIPVVAVHVSETTNACWSSLGGPHNDWKYWHIYGFLMEALKSDGTPYVVVSDADIAAGTLMSGTQPKYPILISLAAACISDATANEIKEFVQAGGYAYVGSTSWTRNESGVLRGASSKSGKYDWTLINVFADNYFSATFLPVNTIDENPDNLWLNAINDTLPTSIWYEFPAEETISKVGIWQASYTEPWSYRIRDYEIFVSTDGTTWTSVATNTGTDVSHAYQETSFTPVVARFVKITAKYPSWEDQTYETYDTKNWIGLDGFQAYDENGSPIIDSSALLSTTSAFALSAEMGLVPVGTGLIGTIQKLADDPIVSHLTETDIRNWLLPKAYTDNGYTHKQHWAQFVTATDATVLLSSSGYPTMAVKDYGAGRFIYHSEFSPLAGYSGYVVDNFEYGFFRKSIEEAFKSNGVPLVRLSGWPYPYNAAFKTRHDHFLDREATQVEAEYGVRGEWLIRTGAAINGHDWQYLNEILANGAMIGSHTLNEYTLDSGGYQAAYDNINQSLNDLAAQLGSRPKIFVGPGMMAFRDTSKQAIVNNGLLTSGDMSHGPYPNFALKVDTATDYGPNAHWNLLEIPVGRYYAKPGETWGDLIYSHMGSMGLTDEIAYIEKTVDLTYDLGGVINLYDHIGDKGSLWIHPDAAPFEHYIAYSLAKPYVWNTDPLGIYDWWVKRDAVSITPSVSYPTQDQTQVDVTVSSASDQGPFALDIAIPTGSGVHQVKVNGNPTTGYRVEGQKLKVSIPVPAQVQILFGQPLPVTCYALTLDHTGQGSNAIASPANSTGCPAGQYVVSESITLSGATPNTGWQIGGWAGTSNNSSTTSYNTVTMPASAHTTSVNYTVAPPACYALTLGHTGQGSNPVASPVKSAACSTNGQYVAGESITLSGAAPDSGWQIVNWTGTTNNASTANTNTVTMPASAHTANVNYAGNDPLVGYWRFDENTGVTADDSSTYGNDGTVSGATWTSGKVNSALSFDGSNDRVQVPDSTSLSLNTNRVTFAGWIYLTDLSRTETTIIQRSNANASWLDWQIYARANGNANRPVFLVDWNKNGANDVDEIVQGDIELQANTWYFIAATYDGIAMRFYIDGTLRGTTAKAGGTIPNSNRAIWIGGNDAWGEYFAGKIDEFRIYNQALSQAEIQALILPTCYALTLGHTGQGSDPVASPANSTGCPTGQYIATASISLSGAVPTPGSQISSWTGTTNNASTASTNMVTMPANAHAASVNYTEIAPTCYALTLGRTGQGSDPTASPLKSAACATNGQYVVGESITLSGVVPATGWQITSWTGTTDDTSTANTNTVTMPASAHTANVNYTEIPPTCYNLTLGHTGQGSDPVASPTNSTGCPAGQYLAGATINLSGAVPDSGWQISNWTGTTNNTSTASTNTVTMPASTHTAGVNYIESNIVPGAGTYDDANAAWTYTGTWKTYNGAGPYANTLHYTDASGATAAFMFQAPAKFILTYTVDTNRGSFQVSVDGGTPVTINANGALAWQQTYTSSMYSDSNSHTVTITNTGTARADVDVIQIVGPPTPQGAGVYDDANAAWTYTGTWKTYNGAGPYANTLHYTDANSATAAFMFQAPAKFILTYTVDTNRGSFQVSVDGGTPVTINANGALAWQQTYTSIMYSDSNSHTVTITNIGTARADVDAIQIVGPPTPQGAGVYDDANAAWTYTGTWKTYNGAGPYANTLHYTDASGAAAAFMFQAPAKFILSYTVDTNRGSFQVSVDGGTPVTINANGALAWQQTYTSIMYSDSNSHTVTITNIGTARADVDAIQIVGPPTPQGAGVYDDANAAWTYTGTWKTYNGAGPYANTLHYTDASGATAAFMFQAPAKFILTYTVDTNRGSFQVSVDGGTPVTINANGALAWQQTYTSSMYSDSNSHTVTITNTGTARADVDAIQIVGPPTPQGAGVYDDANAAWTYTGTWKTYNGAGPYANTLHYTDASGAAAAFMFQAPAKFILSYTVDTNRGSFQVSVDGGTPVTINANGALAWQQTYTSSMYSDSNSHTVTVKNTGGARADVDAIQIIP